ncbi:MAG: NAD-dependent epimerase/dehydratase family protein, partial [Halanaeroarchaeum sp.]
MTVLVTGAPGWLGSEVVARLDEDDRDVRALVYYGVDADDLASYDVDVVRGDITKPESLDAEVFEDVDEVVHCAGVNHP